MIVVPGLKVSGVLTLLIITILPLLCTYIHTSSMICTMDNLGHVSQSGNYSYCLQPILISYYCLHDFQRPWVYGESKSIIATFFFRIPAFKLSFLVVTTYCAGFVYIQVVS
jgi:hypothetical protein